MAEEQATLSDYVFWRGLARLNIGKLSREVSCRVFLNSSSSRHLRIEIANEPWFAAFNFLNEDLISIEIPGVAETVGLLLSHATINSRGENVLTFGPKRSPIWMATSQKLSLGRTMLVNFAHYRLPSPQHLRFELNRDGWRARFISISDEMLAAQEAMQSGDYRVTHQVEFARYDGALFTPLDAQDFLEKLSLFLSFCRGQWVATSFTVATNSDGEMALEQWGTGRVSSWREPSNWLDQHHGSAIEQLYRPFCERLEDESWNDALSHVVYWFARAETDNVGPDGACILLQATLERLAWINYV